MTEERLTEIRELAHRQIVRGPEWFAICDLLAEVDRQRAPTGTFACPICGVSQPHDHDPETKADWASRPWLVRARRAVGEESFERFMRAALFDEHGHLNPHDDIGMMFRLGQGFRRTAWDSKNPCNPGYDDLAVRALWRAWEAAVYETIAAVRAEEAHASLAPAPSRDSGALRALAERVVPGPWKHEGHEDGFRVLADERDGWHICLADSEIDEDEDGSAHAAYIAACSPDVIIGLLDRLSTLERDAARMREDAARLDAIQQGLCVSEVRGTTPDWPIVGFDVYWPADDATTYTAPTLREAIDKARAALAPSGEATTTPETSE